MKTCPSCKVSKDDAEFGKNSSLKDGFAFYCKQCRREYVKIWRLIQKCELVRLKRRIAELESALRTK